MRFLLRCLAVAGFAAMNIMLLSVSVWSGNATDITDETRDLFHWISALIALPAAAYAGQPFFRNASRAIRNRSMTMDVPISLGVCLALGMSLYETVHHAHHAYFDSAVMLLFFLLLGRVLDQVMRRKTRAVAGNLLALRGETAVVLGPDGAPRELPVKAVKPGDLVLVRPGDRIAVDGVVLEGALGGRCQPRHRRDRARDRGAGLAGLCRHGQCQRRAHRARHRRRRGHAAAGGQPPGRDRRRALARAICASPIARRGSIRPSCT